MTTVGRAVVLEGSTVALTTGSGNPVLEVFDDEGFKYRRSNNDSYAYMFPTGQLSENKIIATTDLLDAKQNTLVSGTNIKTVNGYNIMGSGNISIVEANPAGTASQTLSKVKINNSLYDLAASIDIIDLR